MTSEEKSMECCLISKKIGIESSSEPIKMLFRATRMPPPEAP